MSEPERILILDDDPYLRKTLTDILRHKGYDPLPTARAQEALEAAARRQAAIALIDLRLEDMPGLEVLRRIKELSPDTECIILTGYASQEAAIEAINAGAYSFMQKPYQMQQLLLVLQRALEKRAAARALAESQALYRTFLDATQDIAFLKDELFRYIFCNRANAAFLGRSLEEIIGRDDFELMDAPAAEGCRRSDLQALEENRPIVSLEIVAGRVYEAHKFPVPLGGGRLGVGGYIRDITERLQAEEQMRLQSAALEASANAIVIANREGFIQWANPAFTALTGYKVPDEVFGRNPRDLVKSGKQDQRFYKDLWDTILSGRVWHGSLINRRKDGSLYDEEMTITPLKDSAGQITHFIAVKQDISERKRVEREILESERRYAALVEASPAGIFHTDAAGLTTYVSPRWCEISGMDAQSALGNGWLQAVHPEERQTLISGWEQAAKSGRASTAEYRFLRPDGSLRWVRGQAMPEVDSQGRLIGYVGAILDITEAKQAEEALRLSEERYRGLFEDSPISLWEEDFSAVKARLDDLRRRGVEDLDAYIESHPDFVRQCAALVRVRDVNRATLRIYGAAAKESLLQNLTTIFRDESYESFKEELRQIARGSTNFHWEGNNYTLDGRQIDISLNWAVVPGHEDDLARVIVSVIDITERKRAEAELQQRLEQLTALSRAAQAVSAPLEMETTLDEIVALSQQVSGAEYASVLLVDESGLPVESSENLLGIPALEGRARRFGLTRWIVQNRQPLVVERIDRRGRIYPPLPAGAPRTLNPYLRQEGIRSLAGLPLIAEDSVLGVLYLHSRQPGAFNEQLPLLTAFANQAATAIHKARLYRALERELAERIRAEADVRHYLADLEMLYQSSLNLNRSLDPQQIGQLLVETLARHLNWHHIAIRLRRGESRQLDLVAFNQAGMQPGEEAQVARHYASLVSSLDQGLSGLAARRGESIIAADVRAFPEYVETHPAIRSGLYVPLKVEERVIGVIAVESETPQAFSERDARLLETLAAQAVAAFENARLYQDVVRAAQRREVLYRLSQEIGQKIGSLEAVYETIYRAAGQLMSADNFTIAIHDEAAGEFIGEYLIDEGQRCPPVRASIQEGISGYVIRTATPLRIGDALNDPGAPTPVHYGSDRPSRAYLCVPLRIGERVIGAMSVQSYQPEAYTTEDEALLKMLAAYAAPAIENARLLEDERRRLAELEFLHESSLAISNLLDSAEIGSRLVEIFDRHLGWRHAAIQLRDEIGQTLRLVAFSRAGLSPEEQAAVQARFEQSVNLLGHGLCGLAASRGEIIRSGDVHAHAEYIETYPGIHSGLYVPLKIGQRIIGCITVESEAFDAFSERDERLLTTLASQIAIAFENAHLYQTVQEELLERKQAEEALRQSQTLLQSILDHANAMIYLKDLDGRYLLVNEALARVMGGKPKDFIGKTVSEIFSENDARQYHANDQEVLQKGQSLFFEETLARSDEAFTYLSVKFPLRDRRGKIYAVGGISTDITDQKRTQVALQRLNLELEERVARRTEELRAANVALAKAARLKDEFLASMSHELRTPLTGILGLTEALQRRVYGDLTERQTDILHTIEESGRHLLNLINDILDLSKIEAGRMELELERVSVDELCQASLRLIKQMASAKRQTVSYSQKPPDLVLRADARRLKQILFNLLGNAVKFTPEGGELGLEVCGDEANAEIRFTVWDHGIGIAQEDMDRLFQPFVQLDSSLARNYPGTGLGLSLARRLTELHGGRIEVESALGQGSRFTVIIPWRKSQTAPLWNSQAETTPVPDETAAAHPHTILLVEDNEITIQAISDYLTACKYNTVLTRSGPEALEVIPKVRPDLILMDIQMPGMDGLEAIRRIRRLPDPALANLPIIALTALVMPGDRERCLEAGANDYISKPVALEGLVAVIRSFLESSR
ncbi:MAG: PAS domain S-box protein [Anaerolineales bacterium]